MSQNVVIGSVVLSTQGRDKGRYFAVTAVNGNNVFVADGDVHRLNAPKKKNMKHISNSGEVLFVIAEKIQNGKKVFDSEINSSLRQFAENKGK